MKVLKKILAYFVTLAMVLCTAPIPSFAADAPTVSVAQVSCEQGDTVDVAVTLEGAAELGSCGIKLSYDAAALSATSITIGSIGAMGQVTKNINTPGSVIVGGISSTKADVNGTLFTISFSVAASASADDYAIAFTSAELNDADAVAIDDVTLNEGSVTVLEPVTASITISDVAAKQGENVTVPVTLFGMKNAQGLGLALSYDSDALTLTSVERGTAVGLSGYEINTATAGTVLINAMNDTPIDLNGVFINLNFTIADDAQLGKSPVTISDVEIPFLSDPTIVNGSVTIEEIPPVINPKLSASTVTGEQGSTVDVTITAADLDAVQGIGFELLYDSEAFTATAITSGTDANLPYLETNLNQSGKIIVNGMSAENVSVSGTFATITFTIKDTATVQDYDLTFANVETPNIDGTASESGKITVTAKPIVKEPKLTASTVSGQQGSTVDVAITAADLDAVQGVGFELNFDGDALTPTKITNGTAINFGTLEPNITQKGKVIFNGMNGSDVNVNGTFATITFAIADGATVKDYDLTFANIETPEIAGTTGTNGKITVTAKPESILVSIAATPTTIVVPYANKDAVADYIKANITVEGTYNDSSTKAETGFTVEATNGTATVKVGTVETTVAYTIAAALLTGIEADKESVEVPYANRNAVADYIKSQITVKAVYEDNTKTAVTNYEVVLNDGTATITYNEKETSLTYTIGAALMTGIEANKASVEVPFANKDGVETYIRSQITVNAVYEDGSKPVLTSYTIALDNGTATIANNGKQTTVAYTIGAPLLTGITATPNTIKVPYANKDAVADYIKANVTVTAAYEDSTTPTVAEYTISAEDGTATIGYNGKETTVTYTIGAPLMTGITATPNTIKVPYANKDAVADYIKANVTVTATYEDSTTPTVAEYNIEAADGTATIGYNGKETTVTYTIDAPLLTGITATPNTIKVPYANKDAVADYIKANVTVTATYEDSTTPTVAEYNIEAADGTATIGYNGKETTVTYTIDAPLLTGITATPNIIKVPYANKDAVADYIKANVTVTATYEDSTTPTVAEYNIEAADGTATIGYNGKETTVTYTIDAPLLTGITTSQSSIEVPYANKDAVTDYFKVTVGVNAAFEDGTTPAVIDYTISAANGTITIGYRGKETTVTYTIGAPLMTGITTSQSSIEVPYANKDAVTDYFKVTVGVNATFEDGTTPAVIDYTISAANGTITIGYRGKETTVTYTIGAALVTGIAADKAAITIPYASKDAIGDYIKTQIAVTATYEDGTTPTVTGYTVNATEGTATISFGGKETTVTYTVAEPEIVEIKVDFNKPEDQVDNKVHIPEEVKTVKELIEYAKTVIGVSAKKEDGSADSVAEYKIELVSGKLQITFNNKTALLDLAATEPFLDSITADKETLSIPRTVTNVESYIKDNLTVTANYSDSSTQTVASNDYSVAISGGIATISYMDYDVQVTLDYEVVFGDVNMNGSVELADAQLALKAYTGLYTLSERQQKAASVDGNNTLDLADAQYILGYWAGLIPVLPVEAE